MSDEQQRNEEPEVEAHRKSHGAHAEPVAEGEEENEVEAHVRRANIRMDSPSRI